MGMRMNTKFESSEAQDALTPDYRKSNRRGSALRPQQAKSKDEQWLVDFLANLGIEISKESFGELTDTCTSAPEVLTKLLEESDAKLAPKDKINALVALLELSHRWYPDWVCEENLDDLMQEGYKQFDRWGRSGAGESLPAWERTWEMAKKLKDIWGLTSVFDFDRRFSGMQYLSNWIQDYEMELLNAVVFKAVGETAHDDFVRECVREFLPEDIHKIVHLTVDEDGNVVRDELDEYGNWVNDPWDGEEDNPWDNEDAAKYEALYSGDYVPMASLGMGPEDMPKPRPKPVTTKKIGRNEPCPCGSGKKYKKCCGRGV